MKRSQHAWRGGRADGDACLHWRAASEEKKRIFLSKQLVTLGIQQVQCT
jgi:hypothetical protein